MGFVYYHCHQELGQLCSEQPTWTYIYRYPQLELYTLLTTSNNDVIFIAE